MKCLPSYIVSVLDEHDIELDKSLIEKFYYILNNKPNYFPRALYGIGPKGHQAIKRFIETNWSYEEIMTVLKNRKKNKEQQK